MIVLHVTNSKELTLIGAARSASAHTKAVEKEITGETSNKQINGAN